MIVEVYDRMMVATAAAWCYCVAAVCEFAHLALARGAYRLAPSPGWPWVIGYCAVGGWGKLLQMPQGL